MAHGKSIKKLQVGHCNIYHLENKIHDVHNLLTGPPHLHLLGVTETRLNLQCNDAVSIQNYSFLRKDASCLGQTGIGLYVHDTILPITKRRLDLESSGVECIWIELRRNRKETPSLVCILYRNPASLYSWYDEFVAMMDKITEKHPKSNILILGDFNIDLFKPHSAWESTCSLFGLKQLVTEPTRITPNSSSLLDHIYTNRVSQISNVSVSDISLSDHCPVVATLSCKPIKSKIKGHTTIEFRAFRNFNVDDYLCDLNQADFNHVYDATDPDDALSILYGTLVPIINKHAPLRKKRVKQATLPGWLSGEIADTMKERDKAKKDKDFPKFKTLRNKVSTLVRDAKRTFFSKMIHNNCDTVHLWRAMNAITKKAPSTNSGSTQVHSADSFNNFFLSQAKQTGVHNSGAPYSSARLREFCHSKLNPHDTCVIPDITVFEVGKIISSLTNKRSTGADTISTYLLKTSLPYILEPLTYVYNTSIRKNTFPKDFKLAKVIPLQKTRGNTELNNFRPISLLSVLSKPLEKHIHKHLISHIERSNLLYSFQSGFRKYHSCHTALVRLCDTWLSAINRREMAAAVFLDFRKAFDLIDHDILIHKLHLYLQNKRTVDLLSTFLQGRLQCVYVDGAYSQTGVVSCGVPQGSVLGPLLFCIYINDLPLHISNSNVTCDLFADDSSLHTCSPNISQIVSDLQESLNDVSEWSTDNHMVLHPQKTKSMLIATRQKHQRAPLELNLTLNDNPIEQISSHKVLGVTIDDEFKWQIHINNISKTVARNLHLLRKLTYFVDTQASKLFFTAHCLSHINYASSTWCGAAQVHMRKLNSLHRRGVKLISNYPQTDQSDNANFNICSTNMLSLQDQFYYNIAVFMFKIRHGLAPSYLSQFFVEAPTRYGSCNFILPRTRVDLFKTSLAFSGSAAWNLLPPTVKAYNSLSSFKANLKRSMSKITL